MRPHPDQVAELEVAWIGTLYRGSITFNTPMLYFFSFVYLFVFGGMTGVAVATTSLDVHWHDTYFVIAHFHFIMIGATLTAFLGAIHYWYPKMFGRMYPRAVGPLVGGARVRRLEHDHCSHQSVGQRSAVRLVRAHTIPTQMTCTAHSVLQTRHVPDMFRKGGSRTVRTCAEPKPTFFLTPRLHRCCFVSCLDPSSSRWRSRMSNKRS